MNGALSTELKQPEDHSPVQHMFSYLMPITGQNNSGTAKLNVSICQKVQLN